MHEIAFCNWFGAKPHGIYGTTSTDLIHAILHSIVQYVVKIILSLFANAEKHLHDDLVDMTLVTI